MRQIVRHVRAAPREGGDPTDSDLLQNYIDRRDGEAFALLVRRCGPMVWGVCRRVTGDYHDAEDAFQAVFLVLARKAAAVVPRQMVANWLYGVAYQVALKARAVAARQKARERQVAEMPEPEAGGGEAGHDLRDVLDQELTRLPDKYRAAVVLCDLEGKTYAEAARQLGCPEGTLAARLARARAMLKRRLTRRGVGPAAGALAAVLAREAAAGPPPVLVSTAIAAATSAEAAVVPPHVAALTEGVVKTMFLTKLKIATAVLLAASLGICGVGVSSPAATAGDQPERAGQTEPAKKAEVKEAKEVKPAAEAKPPVPGAVPLKFDEKIRLDVRSKPVKVGKEDLHIVGIGTGTFHLAKESRLKAKLNAAVVQYTKVDYWIYAAVFDTKGRLLGTASHKEEVQYIRVGATLTCFRDIELDFGVSEDFKAAAYVVVSVSSPDVPPPPK
jgi:RNA polymerase sigma factor (sigma-70 family)